MKKIFFILFAVAALVSCSEDLLDIPQKGVVSYDEFYKTEEDAEAAITAAYARTSYGLVVGDGWGIYMPYVILTNLPSDDFYAAGNMRGDNDFAAEINEFRHSTNNEVVMKAYRGLYVMIYASNLVISNFQYGVSAKIDRNISEARVLRAWAHLILAIWWDNPPKIDFIMKGNERPTNTPHNELLEWAIQEFGDAAPYLPSRASQNDKNGAVRLTKEAAYSFMGKAQVFAGKYADAAKNLKDNVINSGKYDLVAGNEMFDLYHMAGDGNKEKVFELNVVDISGLGFFETREFSPWMHNNFWHWRTDKFTSPPTNIFQNGWGGCNPTGEFARALIANDGLNSNRRKAWLLTYDEVLYDLPYKSDETVTTQAGKETDPQRGLDPAQVGLYGHEGYFMWKRTPMLSDKFAADDLFANNIVIMRYAEVLLLYAEACAQSNTDIAGGLAALNKIQTRAGSSHISTSLTLAEVKNEKRFECWMEGTRFPDLVRWGDAASVLAKQGEKIPTFSDLIGKNGNTKHTGFVDWADSNYNGSNFGFKTGKHEYLPYPFSEISTNPNLVQNPGW